MQIFMKFCVSGRLANI